MKGGISGGSYSGKSREPSLSHTVDDCSVLDADAGATGVQIEGGSSEKITEKPKRKREASSGMEGEVEKRQMPNRRDAPKAKLFYTFRRYKDALTHLHLLDMRKILGNPPKYRQGKRSSRNECSRQAI